MLSVTIAGPDTEEVIEKTAEETLEHDTLTLPVPASRRMVSMMIVMIVLVLTAATAAAVWRLHARHR